MAFGVTPEDVNSIPLGSVAVPNESGGNLTALEGGPESIDSNSNKTAPVSTYTKDGNNLTQGTTTDAPWAGGGSAGTLIAISKEISTQLNNLIVQSLAYAFNGGYPSGQNYDLLATLSAFGTVGSATIGSINTSLNQLTISSGALTGMYPGMIIWTDNGSGGTREKLIVATSWNGVTPIQVTTTPVQTSNTRVLWNAGLPGGPGQTGVLGTNLLANALFGYDNTNALMKLLQTDTNGNLQVKATGSSSTIGAVLQGISGNAFSHTIIFSSITAQQLKAGTASKSIYITDMVISTDTAMSIIVQDNAGTPNVLIQKLNLPANSVWSKTFATPVQVVSGNDLDILASATGNVTAFVSGLVQ